MAEIVGSRLAHLIEDRRTSQSAIARAIGISQPSIGRLISGETRETGKLLELARVLQTTPEYLVGESDDPAPPQDFLARHQQEGVTVGTNVSDKKRGFRGHEPERNSDLVELDEIDLRYGLGGTYLDGAISAEKRTFSREWLRHFTRTAPEHLFWSIGDGDSMEPTIRSGEVILIDVSQKTPRMGDGIWAIAIGEIGMIKRLHFPGGGRVELHSDNKLVPAAVAIDDELHIVGRVVAVVRRL